MVPPIVTLQDKVMLVDDRLDRRPGSHSLGCTNHVFRDAIIEAINVFADCISEYIGFCMDNSIPTKEVHCYPNNIPWVTSDPKALLNKKNRALSSGDCAELKHIKRELKHGIRESKDNYKRKLEDELENNNTRDIWVGRREITNLQRKGGGTAYGNEQQANEFNQFLNRFDSSSPTLISSGHHLQLNVAKTKEMVMDFRRNKPLHSPVCISGTDVDSVDSYKYLGGMLDDKLEQTPNMEAVYNRGLKYAPPQDASPCTKRLSEIERQWMHCFGRSVELFLSADYKLPEDAFNWWKRLQLERRNFSAYSETVGRLFEMIPPSPGLSEPRPGSCRTCSLVGNSVKLKGSNYGPEIDSHDIVIRMNHGRTKGYEVDVGTRTTHHIMYPESAVDLDNTTHLVLVPFKIQDLEWLMKAFTTGFHGTSYVPVKSHIAANKEMVMVVNPAFMRCVHDSWLSKNGHYPSTGFMALILALRICDEVHVFGYGADNDGNWSHYWEKLKDKKFKTGLHPGTHEYSIIQKLAEKQILKFYEGR
ncbi:CMP-N-acetylneuraminate-beta-galactosamide-alpha-2,3-sialyltransferase 1-like [Acanthopagrus latus]|uniref:CMP-N-acetylneuraminate-beta-galactosamide- alpha-2,3-sialyltransferase 1-like n=1 Tax=Acanthopagrus latus TaxID=8177 RepID=UPI00187C0438|nr:CMP-N-acetylneuraminate-beta-galactosamide-alpha-2,3-sialyltransferase 1-like [Acanthopagrus latus]